MDVSTMQLIEQILRVYLQAFLLEAERAPDVEHIRIREKLDMFAELTNVGGTCHTLKN